MRKWKTNDCELRENIQQREKLNEIETEIKSSPAPMEYSYAQESLGPVHKPGGRQKFWGWSWITKMTPWNLILIG